MISEQVLYLFLYPWILFIATIPGAVLTFVFAGFAGQLLNYLPEKKLSCQFSTADSSRDKHHPPSIQPL